MSVIPGLEDVAIKYTSLTSIDGQKGILRYRGYDIKDLAYNAEYEEIVHLMFYGELPRHDELERTKKNIAEGYKVPDFVIQVIRTLSSDSDAVAMMETAFGAMATTEKNFAWSKEKDKEIALRIVGSTARVVAEIYRRKRDMPPSTIHEKSGNYSESFLNMCFGNINEKEKIDAMNKALILYVDHEVPASTTAALVASSTLSDMYSSITAALAALKGPLHGGAAEAAYNQFLQIGSPNNVEEWFKKNVMEGKKRLMGFGHRVYKTYDPRMLIFKEIAKKSISDEEGKKLLTVAEKLEELGVKQFSSKGIYPNTDFYSGLVFRYIGFPVDMFTALFALARVTGWLAHIMEYVEDQHRLIRPRAIYTGPERREYVPIEKR
ncbi:citrate synthase [Sulfolobales archaeon HS-7]|nr:citrate synthase [Sulfolobales archaeon HS-7]